MIQRSNKMSKKKYVLTFNDLYIEEVTDNMPYFMNKVKYFAYLPTQSKNGEPEKGKQTYFYAWS